MVAPDQIAQLIATRYADPKYAEMVPAASETIALQLQHRSVRKFTDQPITDDELITIVAAAQSASVSSNLQLFSVVAVRDRDRLKRISEAIGGHKYVEDAAVFLVWVADLNRAAAIAEANGASIETTAYIENTLVAFSDVGIAGQNALLAAESLGMGGLFVGGVRNNPLAVAEELALPKYVFPAVGMALGWPDPAEEAGVKPRVPMEAVLHFEQYDADAWRAPIAEYEQRLAGYYADYGKPEYSWMRTMQRRIGDLRGLHGRHEMRQWLSERGLESN